jgi:Protein of unknown function (DUF2878)
MTGVARSDTTLLLVNVAVFQAGWFACVLGAAQGRAWPTLLLVALIVAGWLIASPRPWALAALIALTGAIGLCWDSALMALGLIDYAPGPLTPPMAPAWILALWLLFATTLQVSLRWLQMHLLAAAALGALAAPLAYWGAARLGALSLPHAAPALWAQAAGWALLLPLLLRLARRLDA